MASISGQEIIKTVNGRLTCYFDGWCVSLPFFCAISRGRISRLHEDATHGQRSIEQVQPVRL